MHRLCRSLLLLASLSVFACAQLPRLIPRAVLFGNPQYLQPLVSPDGVHLAWIAPDARGVLNVWVRRVDEPGKLARVITADPKRGIRDFFWQGDSQHVIYYQDRDGDENWHLYQAPIGQGPGPARDLTPFSAQTRVIAVNPDFPDQIIVALNRRDARFHDAYRLHLSTGQLELLAENPGDVEYFVADNAMQVRAAFAQLEDGSAEIRTRDASSGGWRRLTGWEDDEVEGQVLGFSPDNHSLWYTSSVGSNAARLLETEIVSGKTRILATDLQDQYDAGRIIVHPQTQKLQAVEFNRTKRQLEFRDAALRSDFASLSSALPHSDRPRTTRTPRGYFEILSRDQADRIWTVSYTRDNGPVAFLLYDRTKKRGRLLFYDRPELNRYQLAEMRPVTFPAKDGLQLFGYLTLPVLPHARQKNLPLIVYPHGGPYDRDDWGYNSMVQLFANRGYAVLQINYRGSTGYGKRHLRAGFRERGGKMSTDLVDGKRWAVAQGYANASKTCMYGVSYGGYAVLIALTFTPAEFACGVEAYGASNLISLLKSFPSYWTLYRRQWERRVGYAHEEEFLKSRSALFKVDKITAPLLIGQGANDPRVVQGESDQMVKALRDASKPVDYLVFPDEGHGFLRPENRTRWFGAVETFLSRHLGGRAEPAGPGENWDALRR